MKHYTYKLTALLLAVLIIVSPIAQYACAEETVYYTETKYPLLVDVRDQLDEDEIVAAYDVIINMGDYFNPADVSAFKVEKTSQPTDKVEVSFFSAHATDGTVFTSDMPGSYFAYYIARPVSGHPAYEVSRRITVNVVEEPTAPMATEAVDSLPDDEAADEDSEDDPYEESEINDSEEDAFDDEGDDEEEYIDTEEFPEEDDSWEDEVEDEVEDEDSEWDEDSEEDYSEEYADSDDEEIADQYDDSESPDDEMSLEDDAEATLEVVPETMPEMPQIYDEPITTPEPTEAAVEDVPTEASTETLTEAPEETLTESSGDVPEPSDEPGDASREETPADGTGDDSGDTYLIPVEGILSTLADPDILATSLASVDGEGDDAAEEDDDMEEIDPDNIVLEGDAKMVRGKKVSYPSSLGSWSTFKYTVNGKMAYCLESSKTSPKGGSFAQEILDSNPNLTKALYYGYGGPEDLSASFFPDYSANVRYILTHIAASYFFTGSYSSATKGCSSSGLKKYRVQEWIDYIAGLEDPPSPGISLSDKSLEVTGIANGVQTTSSTTLNADHRNTITLALPDNVTYHNESTGETQTGGTVTIGGGTTFHFSAPTSVSGTWKTGDMKGMIAMIWKVLVVKTGTEVAHPKSLICDGPSAPMARTTLPKAKLP